jgi:hypothetical protein
MQTLVPPQLVVDSRMLYFGWIPADTAAVDKLLPAGLRALPNRQVFMNQYQVDSADQTSHFGVYSLTYMGVDVSGLDIPGGAPGRWWTHYINSSEAMREYGQRVHGIPASPGATELELKGNRLVATTYQNGRPVIRTIVEVGSIGQTTTRGHIRYITRLEGQLISGRYALLGRSVDPFRIVDLQFLDPDSPVYDLRPKSPLEVVWGGYYPKASFSYPGGQEPLTAQELDLLRKVD